MTPSPIVRFASIMFAAAALAGCADRSALGITGDGGDRPAWLVGSWRYTLLFTHEGQDMMSRTTWRFESSGTAVRRVETANLTHGLSDVVERGGQWRLAGSNLTVTFPTTTTPDTYAFPLTRESATRIRLGDIPFVRISP